MVYDYPELPHERKHGPVGYDDYQSYKPWLRDEFTFRCVYCLRRERFCPDGKDAFGADHLTTKSVDVDAENISTKLVYACNRCNLLRGVDSKNETLSPDVVGFAQHVQVNPDGTIIPLTNEGRNQIVVFRLNNQANTEYRRWVIALIEEANSSGNKELIDLVENRFLKFPNDLPDLSLLRPKSNTKPEGVSGSYYDQKKNGTLPETY